MLGLNDTSSAYLLIDDEHRIIYENIYNGYLLDPLIYILCICSYVRVVHFQNLLNVSLMTMNFLAEPIGGSAPKFSGESTISNLLRERSESLSLTCPAQGSPTPSFRLVETDY